jgi:hypothetical protein
MHAHLHAAALVALLAVVVALPASAAPKATAEPLDLDPELLSKLALERAKTRNINRITNQQAGGLGPDGKSPAECGAVNIGNVITGGKGFQPREVTVVITGDVINANNQCK